MLPSVVAAHSNRLVAAGCFTVAGIGMALLCWLPADHPGFRLAYAVPGAAVSGSFVTLNVAVQQVGGCEDRSRTNTLYRMVCLASRIVFAFGCAQLIQSYPAESVGPLVFRSITAVGMVLMLTAAYLLLGFVPENELFVGAAAAATAAEMNPAEDAEAISTPGAGVEDGGDAVPAALDWGRWLASLVSPYRAAVAADPRLLQLVLCASTSAGTIAVMTQHWLFFFTAELGGSAQAFGAANSFASGLGLVSIVLQGIAVARLADASGSAVLGGVANVVVVRFIIGMLVVGLSQAGDQVQAIACFMLAQALDDGAASAVGMLLADLAGASEGGKASAFGLQKLTGSLAKAALLWGAGTLALTAGTRAVFVACGLAQIGVGLALAAMLLLPHRKGGKAN